MNLRVQVVIAAVAFGGTAIGAHAHAHQGGPGHHSHEGSAEGMTSSLAAVQALRPPALERLPTGAIKPAGWLKDELMLQAKGISGQLPYFWHFINQSSWASETGKTGPAGGEFVPYYIRGLMPLSFQVEDDNLVALRERYTSFILGHQNISSEGAGWLGPEIPRNENIKTHAPPAQGIVSKYWAMQALESVAEGDPTKTQEIVAGLVANSKQLFTQLSQNDPPLNASKWGFARYSDCIVGLQWLIDQGAADASPFLWDLMKLVRTQADAIMAGVSEADGGGYDWESWFEEGDPFAWGNDGEKTGAVHLRRHGVDIGEAMKIGALWWRVSGKERDRNNPYTALMWGEKYLHMSDGMYFADEEVTYQGSGPQPSGNWSGGHTAGRGTETCSIVETMQSMRFSYEITGNVTFMDRLEQLAFNSLPAALWPDVTANVYHHRSNQISCGGQYGFNLFYCCTSNVHQGWPYFVLGQVQTTPNGTVVVSGYAPTTTTLPKGAGTVNVTGTYPFADSVTITVSQPAKLSLRVPCWSEGATVTADGGQALKAPPCAHFHVAAKASVAVTFINEVRVYTWHANTVDGSFTNNTAGGAKAAPSEGAIEVHRGALTYALRPNESVKESVIGCIGGQPDGRYGWNCSDLPGGAQPQFPAIKSRDVSLAATGANWSYGLLRSSFEFVAGGADALTPIPFAVDVPPPCKITVKGRFLRNWTNAAVPPPGPLDFQEAPLETLELVPFGATNIRISVFPELVA